MSNTIMIVRLDHRKNSAIKFQQTLTQWGCLIRVRLGIHEASGQMCSDSGIIVLDLVGKKSEINSFASALKKTAGVSAKLVSI